MAEISGAAVGLALKTIRLLIDEGTFLGNVKTQAEKLAVELERMQWLLRDEASKKTGNHRIAEWVMHFREIAYDAEDLLESYAFKIGIHRQPRSGIVRSFITNLRFSKATRKIGVQIDTLLAKISDHKESVGLYGVRTIAEGSSKKELRKSYSHVIEEDFVGLHDDVEMLVEHLVEEKPNVVSIYGMGGLGKTTLAQKIYNHKRVKTHFNFTVWICISQEWSKSDILKRILSKMVSSEEWVRIEKLPEEDLIRKLRNAQESKTCLLVLDDIWEIDAWESIKHALVRGTKILLTTRNREIGVHIGQHGILHQPRMLSDDECWELLQKKTFSNIDINEDFMDIKVDNIEVLGKEMIKHCGGLPLAVIVLGGVLANKDSFEEWEIVHKNIKHFVVNGK